MTMGNCLPASVDSKIFAARIIKRKDYQEEREREREREHRRNTSSEDAQSCALVSDRLLLDYERIITNPGALLFANEGGKPLTRLWSGVATFPFGRLFFLFLSLSLSLSLSAFSPPSLLFFLWRAGVREHLFLVVKLSEKLVRVLLVLLVTPCNTGDGWFTMDLLHSFTRQRVLATDCVHERFSSTNIWLLDHIRLSRRFWHVGLLNRKFD